MDRSPATPRSGTSAHDALQAMAADPRASWAPGSAEIAAIEEHAARGCSVCARALVNAREAAVDLALAGPPSRPSTAARAALLNRTGAVMKSRGPVDNPDLTSRISVDARGKTRVLDVSAALAVKHRQDPTDAERIVEIDALRAAEPRPGEGSERLLSQLARFLDFTVFFVSIVRGERVTYRVQRGLPEAMRGFRDLRREMSFCTHAVSGGAPLLVENAQNEPFFRGNRAATQLGVAAYAGAPLRTSKGIVIGTLCALDFTPRPVPPATSALIDVFARRAAAEIERAGRPDAASAANEAIPGILERSSERADLHAAPFFRDLLAAELWRSPSRWSADASPSRAGSVLLTVRVPERLSVDERTSAVLALLDEEETAGRIDAVTFGILLPRIDPEGVTARVARLRAGRRDVVVRFAFAPAGASTTPSWIAAATR
ncbi:MAG: GAF domain-containing protein [Polyangiaceae bacterium]